MLAFPGFFVLGALAGVTDDVSEVVAVALCYRSAPTEIRGLLDGASHAHARHAMGIGYDAPVPHRFT